MVRHEGGGAGWPRADGVGDDFSSSKDLRLHGSACLTVSKVTARSRSVPHEQNLSKLDIKIVGEGPIALFGKVSTNAVLTAKAGGREFQFRLLIILTVALKLQSLL